MEGIKHDLQFHVFVFQQIYFLKREKKNTPPAQFYQGYFLQSKFRVLVVNGWKYSGLSQINELLRK